jgi:hypothetical protein
VACLTRGSLEDRVSLVALDEFARYMWTCLSGFTSLLGDIYVAICYFPPISSQFASHGD